MKIEQYTVKHLRAELAAGTDFEGKFLVPRERILAQVNNPRAAEDDVVLFMGFEGDKVIGTLGVIPDYLFLEDRRDRVGWLNNWHASSDKAHSRIGALLFLAALKAYQGRIGVSGFTEAARRVYDGSRRFTLLKQKDGSSAYIRLNNGEILPRKFPWLVPFRFLFIFADIVLNCVVNVRLRSWYVRHAAASSLSVTYVDEIDKETVDFIEQVRPRDLFIRGAAELNWMKKYRWDHPSSVSLFVKIYSTDNKMIGFLFLRVRNGSMTVPYYFCSNDDVDSALTVIFQHVVKLGVRDLLVYCPVITAGLQRLSFPVLYQRPRQKEFLVPRQYGHLNLAEYHVSDGDGDAFI